jgi:protein TonB
VGPTSEVDLVGSSPPDQRGATSVARLMPGEAQPSGGPEGAIPPEYESYVRALRQRVQDRLVYPWTAVRRGQQGVVEIEVRIGREGRLVGVEVVAGASADTLRAAAVTAVRGSAPFPFPSGVEARPLVIRLPVEFRLR